MPNMLNNIYILAAVAMAASAAPACPGLPKDVSDYSSTFVQPNPPLVVPDFATHFVQHKWFIQNNASTNHITTGYIRNAPSNKLVTVDQTTEQGLATSVFDYKNVTAEGLVDNTLTSVVDGDFKKLDIWQSYVNSNFPLFTDTFLVDSAAVFNGLASRPLQTGKVASWEIMYQGVLPVIVYVDKCNYIVGYDYFSPNERTHVTTAFFNTVAGGK